MTAMNGQDYVLPSWKAFTGGKKQIHGLRPQIVESWARCQQAGVNPYNNKIHSRLNDLMLQEMLADKKELIKIAKPVMTNLYEFVKGSGFVVVLADERGYIIEIFGDKNTVNHLMTRNFFQGSSWCEEEAGTNAIGTAVLLQEPIQVSGGEHYCQKHHCLTCSAAPIFDTNGKMIGILDISGAYNAAHLHTLGMAVAAAKAIMAQFDIRRKNQELALANHRLLNIFTAMSDGVLMVDEYGIITQVNPAAKKILNRTEKEVVGIAIDRIFGGKTSVTKQMLRNKESYEDIEIMVDTKKGAFHFLATGQPLVDAQGEVIGGVVILRPIQQIQKLINRFYGNHAALQFSDIVGESEQIMEAIRVASLAANTSSNILIQGESGTGKEIFVQAIHNGSEARNGPFVALNSGVIPRELIGSELFGYVEGAFTGAKRGGKPGKFELASGGTLFLDEIGDMPLEQQVALLRVLQEKKVTRIGSDKVIPIDVRVICATNKNLLQEVARGTFRQDLYYRLNVISITVPPLRERVQDIPVLFRHFLNKMGRDRGCKFSVDPEVIECLIEFDWPGNVRELQNLAERVVSLAESEVISLTHLPAEIYQNERPVSCGLQPASAGHFAGELNRQQRRNVFGEVERQRILSFLTRCGGNISMVAQELGISRNTLYRKMRLHNIKN